MYLFISHFWVFLLSLWSVFQVYILCVCNVHVKVITVYIIYEFIIYVLLLQNVKNIYADV